MHKCIYNKFLAATVTIVITSLASSFQAVSQTGTVFVDDALTVATADSLSLSDTLPCFANLGPFCSPIRGRVLSHFGPRRSRFHAGTDIFLHHGDSVRAAFTGIVTKATRYYGYGLLVILNHGSGVETYYSHLSKILVHPGDTVPVGTIIGLGGQTGRATGPHLHFEFRLNHIAYNSESLFDFRRQLVLTDSIPHTDSIPAYNNRLFANKIDNQELYYTIQKNDTLYTLARHYGTSVNSICAINSITPNSILKIGQKLKVK